MKLSLSTASVDQFDLFKRCGFDACEFQLGAYLERGRALGEIENVSDAQIQETFTEIREKGSKIGFEIPQTHSAFSGHPRGYDYNIDEIVKRQIASIKATHYLGGQHCVVHPIITPGRRYDLLNKESFNESVEFYKQLTDTLEEYDVYCCLENMWVTDPVFGHICSTILSHAEEMVEMCEILGDRFKICIDVGHGPLTQDDPAQMARICGDKLYCLHTHDNDGILDLHTFPFTPYGAPYGTKWKPMRINWQDFMKALDDANYRGTLNFEVGIHGPAELHEATLKYLAAIGEYLVSLREIKY